MHMKPSLFYIKTSHIACELVPKQLKLIVTFHKLQLISMACLNMVNNDQHQGLYSTMSPRISFSNDFANPQQPIKLENSYREAPVSSDFAFKVPNYTMISADELFFKGKMVPLKENCTKITTIKDELLAGDDDYDDVSPRMAKGASWWKERLGLKRSHVVGKKCDKNVEGSLSVIDEMKTSGDHL